MRIRELAIQRENGESTEENFMGLPKPVVLSFYVPPSLPSLLLFFAVFLLGVVRERGVKSEEVQNVCFNA